MHDWSKYFAYTSVLEQVDSDGNIIGGNEFDVVGTLLSNFENNLDYGAVLENSSYHLNHGDLVKMLNFILDLEFMILIMMK